MKKARRFVLLHSNQGPRTMLTQLVEDSARAHVELALVPARLVLAANVSMMKMGALIFGGMLGYSALHARSRVPKP